MTTFFFQLLQLLFSNCEGNGYIKQAGPRGYNQKLYCIFSSQYPFRMYSIKFQGDPKTFLLTPESPKVTLSCKHDLNSLILMSSPVKYSELQAQFNHKSPLAQLRPAAK